MKKRKSNSGTWLGIAGPLVMLIFILLFCLWNGHVIHQRTAQWMEQLNQAEILVRREAWPETLEIMENSLHDWQESRTYLHMMSVHDMADEAQILYSRCLYLAREQDTAGFLTELSELRNDMEFLSERENISLGNIF